MQVWLPYEAAAEYTEISDHVSPLGMDRDRVREAVPMFQGTISTHNER
jgi:hypothetical protein